MLVHTLGYESVNEVLAAGKSNKEIEAALGVSANTVKTHLTCILHKLGVSSRTQAVTVALKRGLLQLQ